MAQVRIDDDVYARLKEAAEFEHRTVGQEIAFLLDNELTFDEIRGALVSEHSSMSGRTPLKDTSRGHTVTIPSVDTSQPRESITPHKRWVPTTPEELEAELEKVRRGEREP